MKIRPVDQYDDILPVLSISDLISGGEATALLVKDRLTLYTGEWWENPSWGCDILDRFQSSRITEADLDTVSSALSAYVRETNGVQDVQNVICTISGRQIHWSCTVLTSDGSADVSVSLAS